MSRRVLFIDRDGALIVRPRDENVALHDLRLLPGVVPALKTLRDAGHELMMVAQPGSTTDFLLELFSSQGAPFKGVCGAADLPAAIDVRIDGRSAAQETWPQLARRLTSTSRTATVARKTKETDVNVEVRLDDEAPIRVATGIGFFDHMLEQIAKHGGFSLQLSCSGDLHIDEHHTVEDCALALGQALKTALGDKRGIQRYGFMLPMDEALARVAIDLSGRPYFVFEGAFGRDQVGQLPTELVPHFFRSLAETLGAAINIKVSGENTHHMIEACFKGVGRALRQAIRITDTQLPSTKGTL
jgi:imidazoleglycerol-phosphate dehydratase / histidinol-phosphatase